MAKNMNCLKKLKSLRENVNWEIEKERFELLCQLYPLISDWEGQYPNLQDIFRPKEIDWLLTKDVNSSRYPDYSVPIIDFVIKTGYKDKPNVDKDGKPLLCRTTPVHRVWQDCIVVKLFEIYNRFDVNYTNDDGYTHFHIACKSGCHDVVEKFLELGQNPNLLVEKTGDSPLHLALEFKRKEVVELLMTNGADPNLSNNDGETPLHIISTNNQDNNDLMKILFDLCDEKYWPLQFDARNKWDQTPLHIALEKHDCNITVQGLLLNGADPNLVDGFGRTALHIICDSCIDDDDEDYNVAEIFFKIIDYAHKTVRVDTRDNKGQTPLHTALSWGCKKQTVRVLLERGANPNLPNTHGSVPLHIICQREYQDYDDDLMETFFKICDEKHLTLQIDAPDNLARTPLQLAVANLFPHSVDVLLDRGADLSSFVFPTANYFAKIFEERAYAIFYNFRLKLASGTLTVVECLEKKGYEPDRSDALTIMKLFDKHEIFQKSTDLQKAWFEDEWFVDGAKESMISPNLSLYDLMRSRPREAEKLVTCMKYYKLVREIDSDLIHGNHGREEYLCEMMSRRFFRRWALDSFLELTRYRLPILCCEVIIKLLANQDLCRIFLAATDQSHEDCKNNAISSVIECNNKRPVRAKKPPKKLQDYVWSRL